MLVAGGFVGYETYNLSLWVVSLFSPFKSEASIWIMRLVLTLTLKRSFRSNFFVWYIFEKLNNGRYDAKSPMVGLNYRGSLNLKLPNVLNPFDFSDFFFSDGTN